MRNYEDIQTITQIVDVDDIPAIDLRNEAKKLTATNEPWEAWSAGAYNEGAIIVLWLPEYGRAGIAWGSDAEWTDAQSPMDALERFFGAYDKEMVN